MCTKLIQPETVRKFIGEKIQNNLAYRHSLQNRRLDSHRSHQSFHHLQKSAIRIHEGYIKVVERN